MNASRTPTRPKPDQRLLVLVTVGLLLLAGPLVARIFPPPKSAPPIVHPVYLWLTGAHVPQGLYRLASGRYGKTAPRDALAEMVPAPRADGGKEHMPAAFRLQVGRPPMPSRPPADLAPFFFAPVAINRADKELLMTLPGIGPRLADAILGLRRQKKKIKNLDELLWITGIGKARIANLKRLVSFD